MQNVSLQLLLVLIAGGLLKTAFVSAFSSILIDLIILGVIYVLLKKQYPYFNLKKIMAYFSGITFVSILVDIGFLRGDIGNLLVLAILGWMFYKGDFRIGGYNRRR